MCDNTERVELRFNCCKFGEANREVRLGAETRMMGLRAVLRDAEFQGWRHADGVDGPPALTLQWKCPSATPPIVSSALAPTPGAVRSACALPLAVRQGKVMYTRHCQPGTWQLEPLRSRHLAFTELRPSSIDTLDICWMSQPLWFHIRLHPEST